MLSFDIRSLDSHAAVVYDELAANDPVWEEDDPKPQGAVHTALKKMAPVIRTEFRASDSASIIRSLSYI